MRHSPNVTRLPNVTRPRNATRLAGLSILAIWAIFDGSRVAAVALPAAHSAASLATILPGRTMLEPAAAGDAMMGRRRARRQTAKDKPYQPLAKDPAGETSAAHKDYLKRYGF